MILIVNMIDVTNETSQEHDAMCYKRGDIIDIVEDTHQFSQHELTTPNWRMIGLTGNIASARHILDQKQATPNTAELAQKRGNKCNFVAPQINEEFLNFLNDDTRETKVYKTNVPLAILITTKPTRYKV